MYYIQVLQNNMTNNTTECEIRMQDIYIFLFKVPAGLRGSFIPFGKLVTSFRCQAWVKEVSWEPDVEEIHVI